MKVFVTGATGFIGSAIVKELVGAGHQVLGLTRSDAGAKSLAAAGAQVEAHRGDLEALESLRSGADKLAIEAIGSALAGSDRPLIVSAGIGPLNPGHLATEDFDPPVQSPMPRVSEQSAMSLRSQGVNAAVVRLPQVHDPVKQGLVTQLINLAREKRVSAYVGEGFNRWSAAHVLDVARLYRLALEKHEAGAKYHAVGEEGVRCRDIAEVIGRSLKIPVVSMSLDEAAAHFGWLAMFAGVDMPASSKQTQERLGWRPTGPGLIADLEQMQYFAN